MPKIKITKTKNGFKIERTACVICDEPPFGGEYCCGHSQYVADTKIKLQPAAK